MATLFILLIWLFGVTAFGTVPLNNRLDAMPRGSAEAQGYWPEYRRRWTRLNLLRGAACLAAAGAFAAAALLRLMP